MVPETEANNQILEQRFPSTTSDHKIETTVNITHSDIKEFSTKYDLWLRDQANMRENIVDTGTELGTDVFFPVRNNEILYHSHNNMAVCLNAKVCYCWW